MTTLTDKPAFIKSICPTGAAPLYKIYSGELEILRYWLPVTFGDGGMYMPFGISFEITSGGGLVIDYTEV
jgi:hypothetical protein